MVHKLKWDDLQIILAVARSGSASRAAASLELNHATVIRRIAAFREGEWRHPLRPPADRHARDARL
jgi:DNA-binding transcriptional LysR family regulator